MILDIIIETPIKLTLYDKDGNKVGGEDVATDIAMHHLRLENDVYEGEYESLIKSVEEGGELDQERLNDFKSVFSHDRWRIIDVDNYMDGNEIIRSRIIMS